MGLLSVPKTVQKPSSPHEDATEMVEGGGAVPKTGRRHIWHAGMPLEHLWAYSPCRRPVRRTLCHAGMPLR